MSTERLQYQGQRAELLIDARRYRMKIIALRRAMRSNLNELTAEESVPTEEILVQASELQAAQIELEGIIKKLEKIKEILGG